MTIVNVILLTLILGVLCLTRGIYGLLRLRKSKGRDTRTSQPLNINT